MPGVGSPPEASDSTLLTEPLTDELEAADVKIGSTVLTGVFCNLLPHFEMLMWTAAPFCCRHWRDWLYGAVTGTWLASKLS